jgi:hypothetical protein
VLGHEVDHVHVVAVLGEPTGVRAGGSTDIEDSCGRTRQVPAQQLSGALELQPAVRRGVQPVVLDEVVDVVGVQVGYRWPQHAGIVSGSVAAGQSGWRRPEDGGVTSFPLP